MNEGIEAIIRRFRSQYIPSGWHISSIEEAPIEGKVAPRFISSLHLKQEPDYHEVLWRLADVLNIALLPSIERYAPPQEREESTQ